MGTALLLGKCVTSCPKGYLLSQSATRGMICDDLYEGSPGIYCYIIWSLLALSLALLLLSFLARKSQFTFTSSLVSLFSVVEFLIRVGILVSVMMAELEGFLPWAVRARGPTEVIKTATKREVEAEKDLNVFKRQMQNLMQSVLLDRPEDRYESLLLLYKTTHMLLFSLSLSSTCYYDILFI